MLPGIGIRCRLQFLTAADMIKMPMSQKNSRRVQSVLFQCLLYFLSVIRRIEYQRLITAFPLYKITVGLVDSQQHMSDTDIAHNTLTFCFLPGSAISPGIHGLTCGSLNINNAVDPPVLVDDTVQFLSAADLEFFLLVSDCIL